jgi:hypothetical protein
MTALQDQDFFPGLGKIRSRSKTVMAAADDYRIVSRHLLICLNEHIW